MALLQILFFISAIRRYMAIPYLIYAVIMLVRAYGGSSLQICLNAVAVLFLMVSIFLCWRGGVCVCVKHEL